MEGLSTKGLASVVALLIAIVGFTATAGVAWADDATSSSAVTSNDGESIGNASQASPQQAETSGEITGDFVGEADTDNASGELATQEQEPVQSDPEPEPTTDSADSEVLAGNDASGDGDSAAEQEGANLQQDNATPSQSKTTKKSTLRSLSSPLSASENSTPSVEDYNVDGQYYVESMNVLTKVVDVQDSSKEDKAAAVVNTDSNKASQKWTVSYSDKGYTFLNANSQLYLGVGDGNSIIQTSVGSNSIFWKLAGTKAGGFTIASLLSGLEGLYLSVVGSGLELNDVASKWYLQEVSPEVSSTALSGIERVYAITNRSAGKVFGVSQSSKANKAEVVLGAYNGTSNQKWDVQAAGGGFYYLVAANSGKVLDVADGHVTAGSKLVQSVRNASDSQMWSVRIAQDGSYVFVNKASGKALDRLGNALVIGFYSGEPANTQKFRVSAANLIDEGVYSIGRTNATSQVVDVYKSSKANGATALPVAWKGSQSQKVDFALVAGQRNVYTIRFAHSGLYLGMDSNGKLIQTTTAQKWKPVVNQSGTYNLLNVPTNKSIVVSGTRFSGVALDTGQASQQFSLARRALVANGLYAIRTGSTTNTRVLDVSGASKNSMTNVLLWTFGEQWNQKFTITHIGNGVYKIINYNSNKTLAVAAGGNVVQAGAGASPNQQWIPRVGANGSVIFVNKKTGLALNLSGSAVNGRNVNTAKKSNGASERWYLTPTTKLREYEMRALAKAKQRGSSTNYYFVINLTNHTFLVLKRANRSSEWKIDQEWLCTTGMINPNGSSRTTVGDGRIGGNFYALHDANGTWSAYWVTSWGRGYLHSTLRAYQSMRVIDGRLGYAGSGGCVRLADPNIQWIYNNNGMFRGTSVTCWW